MKTKFIRYTGYMLLIVFITIFLHSELIGHASAEHNPEQFDICNLISNTIKPQQNESQQLGFTFHAALFLLSENASFHKKTQSISYPIFSTIPKVSRTILYQFFLN